ncbi:unnamed protein product [Caenorhabditis angaria]|uniref:Mutator-like transposase domain-containing protein n=1 Tax=Caenorhabditis angaria TaxID=860376 RepID=A0A9P1IEW2_9PELO|nr:unnamed protein product [Caenorhabditis angaria]
MYSKPHICRSHFEWDSWGKIARKELPKPFPFLNQRNSMNHAPPTSNIAEITPILSNLAEITPPLSNLAEITPSTSNTAFEKDMDVHGDATESLNEQRDRLDEVNPFQEQIDMIKDPNYQPTTRDFAEVCEEECEYSSDSDGNPEEFQIDFNFLLVSIQLLLPLILYCRACCSQAKYKSTKSGCALDFHCYCECGRQWKWASSRRIVKNDGSTSKRFDINVIVTSAIVTIGQSYSNLKALFDVINMPTISSTTFYDTRKIAVVPAINTVFAAQKQLIMEILKKIGIPIDAASDGMYDTRGYSAFWCRYIFMCTLTKFIIHYKNMRKTSGGASKALEPAAHMQGLRELISMYAGYFQNLPPIRSLTTDRCLTISANMKLHFPSVIHKFDLWHLIRNITMDLWPKRNQKQMEPIKLWLQAMINNIYQSVADSNGDPLLAKEMVMSTFAHITNQHTDFDQITWFKFNKLKACRHDAKSTSHTGFLNVNNAKDMNAWDIVRKIFIKGNRLEDIGKISAKFCTSECESFNSLSTKYAPKDKYFHEHETTTRLSILHWNQLKLDEFEGTRVVTCKNASTHEWRFKIRDTSIDIMKNLKKVDENTEEVVSGDDDEGISMEKLKDNEYFAKRMARVFEDICEDDEDSSSSEDEEV